MPVYLAAALGFGFYLSAVPLKFALLLRVGERVGFGAGSAAFEGRFALRRARLRACGRRKHLPWKRAEADLRKFRAAAKLLRRLLSDTRLEALCLSGRVGLPDAAQTALAVGFIQSTQAALSAALGPAAVRCSVEADFSGGGSELALWGMFSIRAGKIMLGALRSAGEFAHEYVCRRIREWTGIPLKIS